MDTNSPLRELVAYKRERERDVSEGVPAMVIS